MKKKKVTMLQIPGSDLAPKAHKTYFEYKRKADDEWYHSSGEIYFHHELFRFFERILENKGIYSIELIDKNNKAIGWSMPSGGTGETNYDIEAFASLSYMALAYYRELKHHQSVRVCLKKSASRIPKNLG